MSSSLTAALLGLDGETKDPRYGPARRKQALAQSYYKTATDTSPAASPFAALARALTVIPAGVMDYMGNRESEAVTKAYDTERDELLAQAEGPASWQQNPVSSLTGTMPPQTQQAPPQRDITGGGAPVASRADLDPIVMEAAARHGLPPELAKALFQQESSYGTNPAAKGNIGQIIDSTAANPGFGMEPISAADRVDDGKNVDFSLRYLKARGEAAGVKDWKDPKQWALALKAYNGGGDPDYVEHVARYLPSGTAVRTGGTDYAGPGVPPAQDGAPVPGQQPTATTDAAGNEQLALKFIAQGQKLLKIDPNNPHAPQIKAIGQAKIEQGKLMLSMSQHQQTRADRLTDKADERAYQAAQTAETRRLAAEGRVPSTVTMLDPDGKTAGIYEHGPGGKITRIGDAPKQPGESGGPFAGTGMDAQANNVLLSIGPKMKAGTASETERGQYALAYEHLSQGRIMPVPDPTDPTGQRQVLARIPGAVPSQFPAPGGAAAPTDGASGGAGNAPIPIPGTAKPAVTTDTEKTAAGYALRTREAGKVINELEAKGIHTGNTGQALIGAVPGVGNFMTNADYQVYQQQMQDWVRAKLRRESGAVIGKDEMAAEIKTYFPEPGDQPEKIAAKRKSRENAERALEESGGRAKIESAPTPDTGQIREVKTPADAEALPPGTRYRTPDGRTFTR